MTPLARLVATADASLSSHNAVVRAEEMLIDQPALKEWINKGSLPKKMRKPLSTAI